MKKSSILIVTDIGMDEASKVSIWKFESDLQK